MQPLTISNSTLPIMNPFRLAFQTPILVCSALCSARINCEHPSAMLHVINRIDARVTRSSRNPVTEEFRVIFFPDEQDRDKVSDESVRSQAMRFLEDETKANSGELTGQETFEQFMSGIDATQAANRASREKAFLQMQNAQDIEHIINRQGRNELFDERMTLYENIVKQQLSVQDARSSGYLAMMMTAMDKADRMQVDASSHMKEKPDSRKISGT